MVHIHRGHSISYSLLMAPRKTDGHFFLLHRTRLRPRPEPGSASGATPGATPGPVTPNPLVNATPGLRGTPGATPGRGMTPGPGAGGTGGGRGGPARGERGEHAASPLTRFSFSTQTPGF